MPCTHYETPSEKAAASVNHYKSELDKVTAIACEVLGLLEDHLESDHDQFFDCMEDMLEPTTMRWWRFHQANDAKRIREQALAKLTPEEIEALGIN